MDLKDLRCIAAIAETGSFLRAAEALNMSQPSVSARMRALEDDLGFVLFDRMARGVSLTSEGQDLLQHARTIVRQFEEAEAEMQRHRRSPSGLVRVGLPTSLTASLATPLLERCMADLPNVKLRIVESMSGYILQWLQEDRLDLGIMFGLNTSPNFVVSPLAEEDLLVAGSTAAALAPLLDDAGEVPFARLAEVPFILPGREHGLRSLIDRKADEHGVVIDVAIEIDAFAEIQTLVSRGFGYTVLSSAVVRYGITPPLATARVTAPVLSRIVNLAWSATRPQSRSSREVARRLEATVLENTRSSGWLARSLA